MTTDPSGTAGGIATIVGAALALLIAFGVPLSPEQEQAILRFLVVAGPAVTALAIRRRAFAPTTVESLLAGETEPALVGLNPDRVALLDPADRPALEAALLEETPNGPGPDDAPIDDRDRP